MLYWAVVFAVLAMVAGVLGFGGFAGSLAFLAKMLLFIFLALFVISLLLGRRRGLVLD
jgi:uncharacterized membrane protein YtjA (UPF0391 family)